MDFLLNITLNRHRGVTGVFAGGMVEAHKAGVDFCNTYTRVHTRGLFDVVLTTGGGAPLDRTYYQSVKGAAAAAEIVKPGGTILLAARCDGGIGSAEFQETLTAAPDRDGMLAMLRSPGYFKKDQWMAMHLCHVLERAEVLLFSSGLAGEARSHVMVKTIDNIEDTLQRLAGGAGQKLEVAVLPQGPYVLAVP
jgi:nickel-dependent lactate racemase